MNLDHRHDVNAHHQAELRQAERQVEAFIYIMSRRYGVSEDEIPEMIDGIRWAIDHRKNIGTLSIGALMTLATIIVGALVLAVWEGAKVMIHRNTGGG